MCKCIVATMVIEICSFALFEIDFMCIIQIYINYIMLFKYLSDYPRILILSTGWPIHALREAGSRV